MNADRYKICPRMLCSLSKFIHLKPTIYSGFKVLMTRVRGTGYNRSWQPGVGGGKSVEQHTIRLTSMCSVQTVSGFKEGFKVFWITTM